MLLILEVSQKKEAKRIINFLRENGITTETAYEEVSLKSQMRRADRLGVNIVIIIGEDEIKKSIYRWKNMKTGVEGECSFNELIELVRRVNDQK